MPEVAFYRLSLGEDVEKFRPEIEYVLNVAERWYPILRRKDAPLVLHYGANPPDNSLVIPALLFPRAIQIGPDGLRLKPDRFVAIEAGQYAARFTPSEPRITSRTTLAYDAIGLAFFMLSRIEERDCPSLDRYGRFPYESAFAVRTGQYATPLADISAFDIASLICGVRPTPRTAYSVRLTHDVDSLRGYHRLLEPLRFAAGDVIKRQRISAAWQRIIRAYFSGEPWRSFRDVMFLSERHGLKSHFYFMGPTQNSIDSPYTSTMEDLLRRVVDEVIKRGHHIGFHPGVASALDRQEWLRQRDGLEQVIGRPVREGRQHVLMYRAEFTPDIWNDAGMEFECTQAFPEASGFRTGTCRPFPGYSLVARRQLNLIQGATAILDFGLFGGKYRDLSVDIALDEAKPIIETCRRHGGELTILFHTGQSRGRARDFYSMLLPMLT